MHAKYFDSIFRKALHIIVIIPLRLNIQSEPFEFLELKYFDIDREALFYEPVGMRIVNDSNPKLRDMAEYSFGTVLIP